MSTKRIALHRGGTVDGIHPATTAAECVLAREPFKAGGMSGRWLDFGLFETGKIYNAAPRKGQSADDIYQHNSDFVQQIKRWAQVGGAYVIYSYGTPIVAMSCSGDIATAAGYWSPTTSKHQGYAAYVLGVAQSLAAKRGATFGNLLGDFGRLEHCRQANELSGYHFWSADTIRFFASRTSEDIFGGCVLVDSTRDWSGTRREYKTLVMLADGRTMTHVLRREFDSLAAAKGYAARLGRKLAWLRAMQLAALGVK